MDTEAFDLQEIKRVGQLKLLLKTILYCLSKIRTFYYFIYNAFIKYKRLSNM